MTITERLKVFIKESREEYRHVNWPNRNEAIHLTIMVIAFSVIIAAFLGFSDSLFVYILRSFVL